LSPYVSCEENEVFGIQSQGLTYKWAQKARVLHCTMLERITMDKHSGLFCLFIIYEENKYCHRVHIHI